MFHVWPDNHTITLPFARFLSPLRTAWDVLMFPMFPNPSYAIAIVAAAIVVILYLRKKRKP